MTCFILLSFLLFSGFSYNSPGGGMMDSCYTTDGNDQGRETYYRHIPKCKVSTKDTFPKQLYPSQSHYLIGFLSGTYPFLSLHSWNCVVEDRNPQCFRRRSENMGWVSLGFMMGVLSINMLSCSNWEQKSHVNMYKLLYYQLSNLIRFYRSSQHTTYNMWIIFFIIIIFFYIIYGGHSMHNICS